MISAHADHTFGLFDTAVYIMTTRALSTVEHKAALHFLEAHIETRVPISMMCDATGEDMEILLYLVDFSPDIALVSVECQAFSARVVGRRGAQRLHPPDDH